MCRRSRTTRRCWPPIPRRSPATTAWEVYYRTTAGDVLLPIGYSADRTDPGGGLPGGPSAVRRNIGRSHEDDDVHGVPRYRAAIDKTPGPRGREFPSTQVHGSDTKQLMSAILAGSSDGGDDVSESRCWASVQ